MLLRVPLAAIPSLLLTKAWHYPVPTMRDAYPAMLMRFALRMTQALPNSSRDGYDAMPSYGSLEQCILYLHMYLGASTCVDPLARPMRDISSRNYESAAGPTRHGKHENAVSEILVARMHSTRKVADLALNLFSKIRATVACDRRGPGLSATPGRPGGVFLSTIH